MAEVATIPELESLYLVTHDVDLALTHADRILLLRDGSIVADGPPSAVIADEERWIACNLRSTSLMRANARGVRREGRFLDAEALARQIVGGRGARAPGTERRSTSPRTDRCGGHHPGWRDCHGNDEHGARDDALGGHLAHDRLRGDRRRALRDPARRSDPDPGQHRVRAAGLRPRAVLRLRVRADRRLLHRASSATRSATRSPAGAP